MLKTLVYITIISLLGNNLYSQVCSSDELRSIQIKNEANYIDKFQIQNDWIQQQISKNYNKNLKIRAFECQADGVITLPVVFHIIHYGETKGTGTNISDDRIKYELQNLNQRFRKIRGEDGNPSAVGADMEIEFALAIRDPNGNKTTGIVRHYDSTKTSINYRNTAHWAILNSKNWSATKYINIYITNLDGGIGGFSFRPGDGKVENDFIAITNNYSGSISVLTHEMGHFLGLEHTFHNNFGPEDVCPTNNDCMKDGDYVCDTPPYKNMDGCNLTSACSPNTDMSNSVYNYMSYCVGASNRFTAGQKERARSVLFGPFRWKLINSEGLIPNDIPLEVSLSTTLERYTNYPILCDDIIPEIKIKNLGLTPITKLKIGSYINGILQGLETKNLNIPSNTEITINLNHLQFKNNGENNVSFKIEEINDKPFDSYPLNNIDCRTVFVHLKNKNDRYQIDFEKGNDYFLANSAFKSPKIVDIKSCDDKSNKVICFPAFNPISQWYSSRFTLPSFDLDSVYSAHIVFEKSYKEEKYNSKPGLFIYMHEGCEINFNSQYNTIGVNTADNLKTVTGRDSINTWIPTKCTDWKKDSVDITQFKNKKYLKLLFVFGSYNNNYGVQNLYLDNISINKKYQIKINSNGIVKYKVGNGIYSEGSKIIVEAIENPNSCYRFKNWTENGKIISNEPNLEINVTKNRSLFANFEFVRYNVTIVQNISNAGSIFNTGTFNCDTLITLKAIANSGYLFNNWMDESNIIVSKEPNYTIKLTRNTILKANFSSLLENEPGIFDNFNIYPNPTKNELNIKFFMIENSIIELNIIDIKGNKVWDSSINEKGEMHLKINISNFPTGEYLLQIRKNDSKKTFKIVKQ